MSDDEKAVRKHSKRYRENIFFAPPSRPESQSKELTRGPPELVQHFRL
jgi:hypothetical protein